MPGIRTLTDVEVLEHPLLNGHELPENTYDMILDGAVINPEKEALAFFLQGKAHENAVTFTYRNLIEHINRTANLFYDLGIRDTDVVSIILPNLPETFFSIFGGQAVGIVNPIDPQLEPGRIAAIMNAAGTKVLVTLAPFPNVNLWNKVASILNQVPSIKTVLQVDLIEYLFGMKRQVVRWLGRSKKSRYKSGDLRILDFNEACAAHPGNRLVSGRIPAPGDIASYYHVDGTTNRPKLAQYTHRNEVHNAWSAARHFGFDRNQVVFCGLPLFRINTVTVTGMVPFGIGAKVILGTPGGFQSEGVIEHFWKIAEHYRISSFVGVPSVYSLLLDVPVGTHNIRSIEFALCGEPSIQAHVLENFEHRTGIPILEGYGLTNGLHLCAAHTPGGERRIGSIGVSLPGQTLKSVQLDVDDQYIRDSEPEEIGTIIASGPNVFAGYIHERHNQGIWLQIDDAGGPWLNTGERGYRDVDGYFWLFRPEEERIVRDEQIMDSRLIEEVFQKHPAVALVAVIARPDSRECEVPAAYVQLKTGCKVTTEELEISVQQHIPEWSATSGIVRFMDEMPLTSEGRINKSVLIGREIQAIYEREVNALDGIASVDVGVGPDLRYGVAASISVVPGNGESLEQIKARIHEVLGRYPIAYEVVVEQAPDGYLLENMQSELES